AARMSITSAGILSSPRLGSAPARRPQPCYLSLHDLGEVFMSRWLKIWPVSPIVAVAWVVPLTLTIVPAAAQTNLTGYWDPIFHEDVDERIPGPSIGDYLGLPINDAARLRADSWDASLLSLPEHQCKPHPSTYGFRGVGTLRVWEERDEDTQQLIAIHTHIQWQEQHRTIWMDGREHPPAHAPHTWQGFSTGRFEGGNLVVRTTHL